MLPFVSEFSLGFRSAYRKVFDADHFLTRLIQNQRNTRDNNLYTGAVLIDLSKAFECIPHDLLVGKLCSYGLVFDIFTFYIYIYIFTF